MNELILTQGFLPSQPTKKFCLTIKMGFEASPDVAPVLEHMMHCTPFLFTRPAVKYEGRGFKINCHCGRYNIKAKHLNELFEKAVEDRTLSVEIE